MRLIDADELLKNLMEEIPMAENVHIFRDIINNQPTAYDVDKIVEQLEAVKEIMTSPIDQDCFGEECKASDCTVCLTCKAIEIVRGGGVE